MIQVGLRFLRYLDSVFCHSVCTLSRL
jgi:hypothetical protein